MNDNTELLKFAVENIEEWPENIDYLSVGPDRVGFNYSVNGVDIFSYHFRGKARLNGFKTYSSIRREEWEEARKEYTIQLTEEGAKRVFEGLENLPPISLNLLEAAKKVRDTKTNTFTKSMLEAGKHVVITDDGHLRTISGSRLEREGGYYIDLDDVRDDLTFPTGDVKAVYQLVWSREDSEKESKRKQLEEEVKKLEQELKLKKEEMEGLK